MPVGCLLIPLRRAEQARLAEMRSGELQPDRQAPGIEAARNGERGQPGERRRDGEDVAEVHLHRVLGLRTELERGGRRSGSENQVALLEGTREVLRDQAPDLLRM